MRSKTSVKITPKSSMTTSRKTVEKSSVPSKASSIRELDAWILQIGGRAITPAQKKKIFTEVRWAKIPGESAPI
jgi:hypothetical protein